jgi:hypothetical protein
MTIPRWQALQAHWRQHPRPEWLIASYLQYKPPPRTAPLEAMRRRIEDPAPVTAPPARRRAVPPPTGELQSLFASLGGQKGRTVVLAT